MKYVKPTLRKYGTFRDLTAIGFEADGDGGTVFADTATGPCSIIPGGPCAETVSARS